jgi:uncharacterized membrane protein YeaQ/YmgE (transglycosylase-associated protein family)
MRRTIMLFAEVAFHPWFIIAWLAVGLGAGWLASKIMENPDYGLLPDLVLGCIGAVIGGVSPGFFMKDEPELWVSLLTAAPCACVFICVARGIAALRSA